MLHAALSCEGYKLQPQDPKEVTLVPFKQWDFVNRTGRTVFVKDRQGAHFQVPPLPPGTGEAKDQGKFHICIGYSTPFQSNIHFNHEGVERHNCRPHLVERRASLRYTLNPNDYAGSPSIYSQDLGLIISFTQPLTGVDVFPDSPEAVANNNRPTLVTPRADKQFALSVVIVDNLNPGSDYYFALGKSVYKITSRVSSEALNLPDGVHILDTCKPVDGYSGSSFTIDECIYSSEGNNLSPITLFTNVKDAKVNGNRTALLEVEKHRMELESREQEREIVNLKHLLAKAKEEALIKKAEWDSLSDQRKDHYESRSYRRKDETEALSMPAKVMTGIAAVATATFAFVKLLI